MKVCQVMAGDGDGGLESHFVELSNGLASAGCRVVAIGHAKYQNRFVPAVKFVALDLTGSRRNPFLLLHLARILRQEVPDIVHAQANKAVAMLASLRSVVPGAFIGTIHNRKRSFRGFNRMRAVIGVSEGVVSSLDHSHLRVIYNGMKPYIGPEYDHVSLARQFDLNPELPISLSVGRLVRTKAFDNLIAAWKRNHGQLIIVGEGPERTALEGMIRQRNVGDLVKLAGFRSDVRGMMSGADLLIFASHREGFSYAMAEALMSGLPVLSTRVPGAEEVLPSKYIVECDDVGALSGRLTLICSDFHEARSDQTELFRWAKKTLTVENMVSETFNVYREVLRGK